MTNEYNMPSITQDGHEWIKVVDHEAEVKKAVEAERERITAWVKQRISNELGDVIAASEGAYRPIEIEIAEEEAHNRAIKCVLDFLTPTKTDKQ